MTEIERWEWDDSNHWKGTVILEKREEGYLVTSTASANFAERYERRDGPYRTREAAEMVWADAAHDLYRRILPTVTPAHLEMLAADRAQLIVDYAGLSGIDLREPMERDWCDCGECDEGGAYHSPLDVALSCIDAQEAMEAHGGDTLAVLAALQEIVEEHVRQAALEWRGHVIQDPLPDRVTDPEERVRIRDAEEKILRGF